MEITDLNGCTLTEDLTVSEPSAITSYFDPVTAVSCNGLSDGSATAKPDLNSGVGGFTYKWSSGGTNALEGFLSEGVYTVTITDANGCKYIDSVSILEPAAVISNLEADPLYFGPSDVRCSGESNASATAYGSAINFSWQDASATVATTQSTGAILSAGTYTLIASDANGCTDQSTILITEPNKLLANISWSSYSVVPYEVSCFGLNDGWSESNPTGGFGGVNSLEYNFVWRNNLNETESLTPFADNLIANQSYSVTVTDVNGCVSVETTPVFSEPSPFIADVRTTNYAGPTHAPFSVAFEDYTVSVDSYNFNWNWEDATSYYPSGTKTMNHIFNEDNIGINNVYVILTNETTGCTDSVPFSLNVQGIPEIDNIFSPNGDGKNDNFTFGEFGMKNIDIVIYNRWGQEVYSWSGENKNWDGKGADGQNLPEAVYFFVLQADGIDGHYYEEKGSVTIIR